MTKTFQTRPLSDALGAEIIGLDLAEALDDETFARVHAAHLEHLVLVFRDQHLSPAQQIAFSRRFGPLGGHVYDQFLLPGYPEILQVSNKKQTDGEFIGLNRAGSRWHSDLAYTETPSLGSLLYAQEIPPQGGDTLFNNMYKAYEMLPDATKARIAGRSAEFLLGSARKFYTEDDRPALTAEQMARVPSVVHPMVRNHPETGRKALYVSPAHTVRILDMDEAESDALLAVLHAHSTQPAFVYRHKWRDDDLVFWDNRCCMHIAEAPPPEYARHMHRTTVMGDRPY
jgi:taurine dioxygenase